MKLYKLLSGLNISLSFPDIEITGVESDSRKIQSGFLFVAISGTQSDGHDYIGKAFENGAVAVVCERIPALPHPAVAFIPVVNSAHALGIIASEWNDNPSRKLKLVGVTGTNGKTTIATLLYMVFQKSGYKSGLLSTICNYIDTECLPATHTTPDPVALNALLAQMVDAGCEYVFMEVSSHAVAQQRISGLQYKGGIFTNLTRDHLDYHNTFDAYRDAKKGFFDALPNSAFALTNVDDANGMFMLQNTVAGKFTYSLQTLADFKAKILETHLDGTLMMINDREIVSRFVGRFNVYNLLAVYGAAFLLEQSPEDILVILSSLIPVAGRFQTLRSPAGYTAIIDYAHTPDALTNVLNAIHSVLNGEGRVITVVGCGGNRDKGKRPIMAKEAAKLSDYVILTSDNPRFEEPQDIINDMVAGLDSIEKKKALCITDRREAIKTACTMAKTGDVVLIAGKGHEDYQEIKGIKHHFDDKEIVEEIFK